MSRNNVSQKKISTFHQIEGNSPLRSPKASYARRVTECRRTPDCFSAVAIDSPLVRSKNMAVSADALNIYGKSDLTCFDIEGETSDRSTIRVGVRVRPFTQRELMDSDVNNCVVMDGKETIVQNDKGGTHRFTYDYSFSSFDPLDPSYASQADVYVKLAQPLLHKVLQGYNACLFAYGQTGSGKSYSIMGHGKEVGIVPRFCEELFEKVAAEQDANVDFNTEISFYEIYNEKIHDLLASSLNKHKQPLAKPHLKVREHPTMGPFVDGLSTYVVKSFSDVEAWLNVGNRRRATAATVVNDNSSRSHSVFTMIITKTMSSRIEETTHKHNIVSKISLVDLAGSERQSLAKTDGDRLREGSYINKALMTLGKVINVLSEQAASNKKVFIPYRESVLTWLLKESLGGNSKTCMLATISPSSANVEESLSTLRYARQARNILNVARINEDPKAQLIRRLQQELERLKGSMMNSQATDPRLERELQTLQEEMARKEMEMERINQCWLQKLKQSQDCKLQEAMSFERAGISSTMDVNTACLVNLNKDPQLSEVLFYPLKRGLTRLGRERDGGDDDDGGGHGDDDGGRCVDVKKVIVRGGGDEEGVKAADDNDADADDDDDDSDCHLDIKLSGALISRNHCIFEHTENGIITITSLGDASSYVNGCLLNSQQAHALRHGDRVVLGGDHFFRFMDANRQQRQQSDKNVQLADFHTAFQEFTSMQNARLEAQLNRAHEAHQEKLQRLEEEARREQEVLRRQLIRSEKKTSDLEGEYSRKLATLNSLIGAQGQDYDEALKRIDLLKKEVKELKHKLEQAHACNRMLEGHLGRHLQTGRHTQQDTQTYKSDMMQFFGELKRQALSCIHEGKVKRLESGGGGGVGRSSGGGAGSSSSGSAGSSDGGAGSSSSGSAGSSGGVDSKDILLMLHEANSISEAFNKDVCYTRDFDEGGGVVVRVGRGRGRGSRGVSTYWTIDKFQCKLSAVRDLCRQGLRDTDNNINTDNFFYDSDDVWEDDVRMAVDVHLHNKHIRRSISGKRVSRTSLDATLDVTFDPFNHNKYNNNNLNDDINNYNNNNNLNDDNNKCSEVKNKNDNNNNEDKKNNKNNNNEDNKNNNDNNNGHSQPHPSYCSLVALAVKDFKDRSDEDNFSDLIMISLNKLLSSLRSLLSSHHYGDKTDKTTTTTSSNDPLLLLVHTFNSLQSTLSHWLTELNVGESEVPKKAKNRLVSCVHTIGDQLHSFIQGIEGSIDKQVRDALVRIEAETFEAASTCGKLSLMCQLDSNALKCLSLPRRGDDDDSGAGGADASRMLCDQLKGSFVNGCNSFVDEALTLALVTLNDSKVRVECLLKNAKSPFKIGARASDLLKATLYTISSAYVLLNKLKRIQIQLTSSDDHTKLPKNAGSSDSHHHHHSFSNNHYSHPNTSYHSHFSFFKLPTDANINHQATNHNSHTNHSHNYLNDNNHSDFHSKVYTRCRSLCTEFSGVVDCSLKLAHTMSQIVKAGDKAMLKTANLKTLLECLSRHVTTLSSCCCWGASCPPSSGAGGKENNCNSLNVSVVVVGSSSSVGGSDGSNGGGDNISSGGVSDGGSSAVGGADSNSCNTSTNDARRGNLNRKYFSDLGGGGSNHANHNNNNMPHSALEGVLSGGQEVVMAEAVQRMLQAINNLSMLVVAT